MTTRPCRPSPQGVTVPPPRCHPLALPRSPPPPPPPPLTCLPPHHPHPWRPLFPHHQHAHLLLLRLCSEAWTTFVRLLLTRLAEQLCFRPPSSVQPKTSSHGCQTSHIQRQALTLPWWSLLDFNFEKIATAEFDGVRMERGKYPAIQSQLFQIIFAKNDSVGIAAADWRKLGRG